MRTNDWQGRRENEKAKKLSEIRKEAAAGAGKVAQDARSRPAPAADEWQQVVTKKGAPSAPKQVVKEAPKAVQKPTSMFAALGMTSKPKGDARAAKKKETKETESPKEPISPEVTSQSPAIDEDATESSPVDIESLPGANGSVDKDTLRRIINAIEEYFSNDLYEEVLLSFRELVHPRGMGEVVKVTPTPSVMHTVTNHGCGL